MKTVTRHLPFFRALLLIVAALLPGGLRAQSADIHNFDGGGNYMDPYLVGNVGTARFGDFGLGDAGVSREYRFTTTRTAEAGSMIVLYFRTANDDAAAGYVVRLIKPRHPLPGQTIGSTFHGDAGYYRFSGHRELFGVQNGEYQMAAVLPVGGLEPGTYQINVSRTTDWGTNGNYEVLLQFPPLDTTYTLYPTSRDVGPASTTGSLALTTATGNVWSAVSSAPSWLSVLAPTTGNGSATINYSVAAYTGSSSRTAQISVGGQTFVLTQSAAATEFSISPGARSHSSRAVSGQTIAVNASNDLFWSTDASAPWITVQAGNWGTGPGSCVYRLAANTTPTARTAFIEVRAETRKEYFVITQAADDGWNPPVILQAPAGGIVLIGDRTVLNVVAAGSSTLSYQWFFNGAAIPGADGSVYAIPYSESAHSGAYTVRVSNAAGQITTAPANIVVGASNPWLTHPAPIPGTIQAVEFNWGDPGVAERDNTPGNSPGQYRYYTGVDIDFAWGDSEVETIAYTVTGIDAGEWLAYTVNVAEAGYYTMEARVAGTDWGTTFHLELDGQNVTGPINIRAADNIWQTLKRTNVWLPVGQQTLRVVWDTVGVPGQGGKFRYLRFTAQTECSYNNSVRLPGSGTSGAAGRYPINLECYTSGPVVAVEATLKSVNHTYPADLDIVLMSPSGRQVLLLSDTGGADDLTLADLTFADGAPAAPTPLVGGRWRPTWDSTSDSWPQPGPSGTLYGQMSDFAGEQMRGTWKLFIVDDASGDSGSLDGCTLQITRAAQTPPRLASIQPITIRAGAAPVSLSLGITAGSASSWPGCTVTSSDPSVLPASRVLFLGTGTNQTMTLSAPGTASGRTVLTVKVTDASGASASRRVQVTVVAADLNIADGVDQGAVTWSTGGDGVWFVQSATTRDGSDAIESGYLDHCQRSWIETTVTGPDTVRFWWKASTGSLGNAFFYLDGLTQNILSGEADWQEVVFAIPAGTHTLRWSYAQHTGSLVTPSRAWIDQITFDSRVYDTWAAANVLTGAAAALTADPDRDGLSNLLEFGCNLLPTVSRNTVLTPGTGLSGVPSLRMQGAGSTARLTLEYLRRKNSGLTYTPQFSDTPATAGWQAATGTPTVTQIDATWERVVIADTFTAAQKPRRFGRVLVTK